MKTVILSHASFRLCGRSPCRPWKEFREAATICRRSTGPVGNPTLNRPGAKVYKRCTLTFTASSPSPIPMTLLCAMVTPRIFRPASQLLTSSRPRLANARSATQPRSPSLASLNRRRYATPSGVKEVAVRDALNEALAEELEANPKVFVLGEEVAQYNGA